MKVDPSGSSIGERKIAMIDFVMLACPVSVLGAMKLSMVVSAIGSAVSFMSQAQDASEKKKWQEANADIVSKAGDKQSAAKIAQNIYNQEATARKKRAAAQEGDAAIADAKGSMISGGVSGLSTEHLLSNIEAQKGQYQFALDQEQEMRDVELGRSLENIALTTQGQMAGIQRPIDQPSMLGTALDATGTFLAQRQSYLKERDKRAIKTSSSSDPDIFSYNNWSKPAFPMM